MEQKKKKVKLGFILVVLVILGGLLGLFLLDRFEGEQPELTLELTSPFISKTQELGLSLKDAKSGLRKLWVSLVKDGKEITLVEEDFPASGVIATGELNQKRISFQSHKVCCKK